MQSLIISYFGGMYGEFMSSLIEKGSDKFVSSIPVSTTLENRFLYPNYLAPIDFECKTFPRFKEWPITESQVNKLHEIYGDKWICIPTHWHGNELSQCKLPGKGISMHTTIPNVLKMAYSLFWIKSHVNATDAWRQRALELNELANSNHPYADKFAEMQIEGNFHNWKFLSYKFNFLKDGELDLYYYMQQHFKFYKKGNFFQCAATPDWFRFDVGNAIHGDRTNLSALEDYLEITVDRNMVAEYADKNLVVLSDHLGLTLDDMSSDSWFDTLYDYCKLQMKI